MLSIENQSVEKVLTMADTLRVIEDGHRELAHGELGRKIRED